MPDGDHMVPAAGPTAPAVDLMVPVAGHGDRAAVARVDTSAMAAMAAGEATAAPVEVRAEARVEVRAAGFPDGIVTTGFTIAFTSTITPVAAATVRAVVPAADRAVGL